MKALVFHGVGDIRFEKVSDPKIKEPSDAIVRLTASAICGTDLHMIRGTLAQMKPGTILGHEGVGIVEEAGKEARNLRPGDRVVIGSTIACGSCEYCRAGYFSQCNKANPNGPNAGTAFFGGPEETGPFNGLQAELARIPFAHTTTVKLPEEVTDDQAILVSDIFPTGYFGANLAQIGAGDSVAVFGCGPVGQFAIASAKLKGAGRIFAIDKVPSRLEMARDQGAETINFNEEDPVEALRELCSGAGPDRVIDAVGVDAEPATEGPGAQKSKKMREEFQQELEKIAPKTNPKGDLWHPGRAPSQALCWAVDAVAKGGTIGIIGVYPQAAEHFPIGKAMNKNLTIQMGNCNHRRYIPRLLEFVRSGQVAPEQILTQREPLENVIDAYEAFDRREPGWIKLELLPNPEARGSKTETRHGRLATQVA